MTLSLEVCRSGAVIYRAKAAALSRLVTEALQHTKEIVLDLAAVQRIDSAGLGELVLLHMSAGGNRSSVKLACPTPQVRELFDL